MKKIIGCTPRIIVENGTSKQFINDQYITMLNNLGFIPVLLPLDNNDIQDILDKCDGFLLTGGVDIDPSYFNQPNQGSENCDKRMDEIDKMVVEYAYKTKKPMMGICRGHQAINVFLGGTLKQDIGKSHQSVRHQAITFKNRLLDFPAEININSYHHQVLDKLAPGFIEVARSKEDGYNEAIIHESLPIFSVQWHPERTPDEEVGQIIYKAFVGLFK